MTTSNSRVTRSPSLVSSFKRFRLKTDGFSEVGRGTQGSVYKAYTKTSPKTAVAIKVKIFWKNNTVFNNINSPGYSQEKSFQER